MQQDFILSNNPITLEATLDKELYYHGETLNVNVQVRFFHFLSDLILKKIFLKIKFRSPTIATEQ